MTKCSAYIIHTFCVFSLFVTQNAVNHQLAIECPQGLGDINLERVVVGGIFDQI